MHHPTHPHVLSGPNLTHIKVIQLSHTIVDATWFHHLM